MKKKYLTRYLLADGGAVQITTYAFNQGDARAQADREFLELPPNIRKGARCYGTWMEGRS